LNTDRIARDVSYQTIIIGELLKHEKQIIINGKDYVHNPESKFTLTVLGAVAELERAKINERYTRGRESRKSRVETPLTVSTSRRTQRRLVEVMPNGHPLRVKAAKFPRRQFLHLAAGAAVRPPAETRPFQTPGHLM
jgi:Resolvase, N terminal domain